MGVDGQVRGVATTALGVSAGRSRAAAWRTAGLAASVLVFAWPEISVALHRPAPSYPLVTAVITLLLAAIAVTWPRDDSESPTVVQSLTPAAPIVGIVAAGVVVVAMYRWTQTVAWEGHRADMLIVIREATRRFLHGHNPYTTYRSYDAPWTMVMPYGPALWAPFLVPQLLHVDFRIVTIIGELFVPLWCGVTAVADAARGRFVSAVSWLGVLVALVIAFDVSAFTLIGHTPVYWPLLPLLAVMVVRRRWVAAACFIGVLVVARTTIVAVVPVFLMAVWTADRRRLPLVATALTLTIAAALAPFLLWDHRAMWDGMIASYPRIMKETAWPTAGRGPIATVGVTEWLIARHRGWLVMPVQVAAMIGVYMATWPVIRRRMDPLPWMALALFAFSMTTLWPVYYLYYDVFLLLVSGAMAKTLEAGPVRIAAAPWLLSLTALVGLMVATVRLVMSPFPHVAAGGATPWLPMRAGFWAAEYDGQRSFSWIVGNEATIVLPRSSASAADIVLTARSPFDGAQPHQKVTAILNGTLLAQTAIPHGWTEVRFAAPGSGWWIGFNELRLVFSGTVSPRAAGAGDDPRQLALALSRVDVIPAATGSPSR
jgi:hypothetical protein